MIALWWERGWWRWRLRADGAHAERFGPHGYPTATGAVTAAYVALRSRRNA